MLMHTFFLLREVVLRILGYPGTTKRALPRALIMLHALPLGISYEKVSMTSGVINVKQGYHEP
jgi:hypothetical protein